MQDLAYPDTFTVQAAIGWLELGNPAEALEELNKLPENLKENPEIQAIYWQISAKREDWEEALEISTRLCVTDPENPRSWLHKAVALYRLQKTQEAWALLLPKALTFPDCWMIPYDLSCYACQLGKHEETMKWLLKAMTLHDKKEVKRLALNDPDLKTRWEEIEKL